MVIAALIVGSIALFFSVITLALMLAKGFFSTHTIQYVDPFKKDEGFAPEMGSMFDPFKEIGDPLTEAEQEALELRKKRIQK